MTCREVADFLSDYLSGDVAQAARAEFDRHLAVCPPCVRYLNTYKKSVDLGKTAYRECDHGHAEPIPDDLIKAILAARQRSGLTDANSSK